MVRNRLWPGIRGTNAILSRTQMCIRDSWKRDKTRKVGNAHISGYSNNVVYGQYVNYGHRAVNKAKETTGWVEGRFMLEKGVNAAERQLPALFDAEIDRIKRETGF